jgi:hypothetical protein
MAYRFDVVQRLEPGHHAADLTRGITAEVADPAWFLGRQWQLGEHRGEDASSPVYVEYVAGLTPIAAFDGNPGLDPRRIPAEAIVEGERQDFWTPGRRVTIGRAVERSAADAGRPLPADGKWRLAGLPAPYDILDGYDGRALFAGRRELDLPEEWFPERPTRAASRDFWDPAELSYAADFRARDTTLSLRRHDGGYLDWWSVDGSAPVPPPAGNPRPTRVLATRIEYPGAPHPRWWQIEEAGTDLGTYAPDRGHFATMLLLELVTSHSDDWFTFPVAADAGHIVTLHEAAVIDAFGERWPLATPDDGWTLFAVTGLDQRSLVLWPAVTTPLVGPVIDQVDLAHDEDANLVWAVERRVDGRDKPTPPRPADTATNPPPDPDTQPRYRYVPSTEVPHFWHPYVIHDNLNGRRRLVQHRLADLTGPEPLPAPAPTSDLLLDPASGGRHPVHQIEPSAIPTDGLQLERRYVLARATDGKPVLWTQRRRLPLTVPPTMRLTFDILEQVPVTPAP